LRAQCHSRSIPGIGRDRLIGPPVIGTVAGFATLRGSLAIILAMLVILVVAGRRALAAR